MHGIWSLTKVLQPFDYEQALDQLSYAVTRCMNDEDERIGWDKN